jgi:hypothetical protein
MHVLMWAAPLQETRPWSDERPPIACYVAGCVHPLLMTTIAGAPVGAAELPRGLPSDFHGSSISDTELEPS